MDEAVQVRIFLNLASKTRWVANTRATCSAFLDFEFWDLPGGRYDIERSQNFDATTLGSCIFVIDAQVNRRIAAIQAIVFRA
jgi:hypothetical protein